MDGPKPHSRFPTNAPSAPLVSKIADSRPSDVPAAQAIAVADERTRVPSSDGPAPSPRAASPITSSPSWPGRHFCENLFNARATRMAIAIYATTVTVWV